MSATFDEIILVSGGLRGVERDRWDMVTDQPPLMMWLYGAAVRGADVDLPPEDRAWTFDDRWDYARLVFFESGSDPEVLLGRARLVTTVLAVLLVAAVGAFAWSIAGPVAGVLGAGVTALLPDVLAHGGVAYNDLPLALAFLLAVWALDAAVRRPTVGRGAIAGIAVSLAFGMKLSALALLPVAALLVGAEWWGRPTRSPAAGEASDKPDVTAPLSGRWSTRMIAATGVGIVAAYIVLVGLYQGDAALTLLRFNFWRTVLHASGGHEAPAFLLGQTSAGGWWYYFPVAFLFKVPVGFTVLLIAATASLGRALSGAGREGVRRLGAIAAWQGRAPLIAALVFAAFLIRSDLNAGFRYALPMLPLLAVLAAVGGVRLMESRRGRLLVPALIGLQAISVLSVYPHFLAYSSVLAGGRDGAHRVISDSSLDWGQGLLELRSFMDAEGIESVTLSYFGSARPEAYGIEYVALPSFFRLATDRTANSVEYPRFTVISATNLQGLYLQGRDPFVLYRGRTPYAVLGHSLFVFDEQS